MDVGRTMAGAALLAGTAGVGTAVAYGAVTAAGESDGGAAASILGMTGGNALIAGTVSGVVGLQATRIHGGGWAGRLASLLTIPAGIAGAALGGSLARAGLERRHHDEYEAENRKVDSIMAATQDALRAAGADEDVLARVRESYDRSYFNASYQPPRGPFGHDITVGRDPDTGNSLAISDVVAHEFGHKVLHAYEPDLLGISLDRGDAGAIHESFGDTVAMLIDRDDWLLGEDATPGGLRSFSNPEERGAVRGGKVTPAPITREQLGSSEEHLGAGVGNKAAWRIGSQLGRDSMGRIYVHALEQYDLPSGSTYADYARILRASAVDLYGAGSHEAAVVDDAWTQAGY